MSLKAILLENQRKTVSQPMFPYYVIERLCACAEGYFCLKIDTISRSNSSIFFEKLAHSPKLCMAQQRGRSPFTLTS